MDASSRIERALAAAIGAADQQGCPGQLAAALRHAVFPGGARVRPRLCLAVAAACGEDAPLLVDAAAAAVELMHCASLVHDDLPCFDDAALRRGRPSVHAAFGERLAVLAGDGLIVMAFQTLAQAAHVRPDRFAPLAVALARSSGVPGGIVAGQAWECEVDVPLAEYQREKTAALFTAAAVAGAVASGAEAAPWGVFGERLGEAYQVADDIRDAAGTTEELGKPAGRDEALQRPSAVREQGLRNALRHFDHLVQLAIEAVPACPGAVVMPAMIRAEAERLLPKQLVRRAA